MFLPFDETSVCPQDDHCSSRASARYYRQTIRYVCKTYGACQPKGCSMWILNSKVSLTEFITMLSNQTYCQIACVWDEIK